MFRGNIYGRECEMQGSPYTLLVFKQEFEEDLPSFIVRSYARDYIDIEEFLRIAWAMCKTYSDDISNYERWLEEFDDDAFDITEGKSAFDVIDAAINAEMFRQKQTIKQRFRRFIAKYIL